MPDDKEQKIKKEPTRLEKKRRLEKSRRDERVRILKKHPLCVSVDFLGFAEQKGWNDHTTDAAALVMHRYFMGERHHRLRFGWLSIPYQTFGAMLGKNYVRLKNKLIQDGFLEYDEEAGHRIGQYCNRFRPCRDLRDTNISASYWLQSDELQKLYTKYLKRFQPTAKQRKALAKQTVKVAFSKDASSLTPPDLRWGKEIGIYPFCHLVQEGHLSETEFATIEKLAKNTFEMELRITEDEISEIADRQYQKPTRKGKTRKQDFSAFVQLYRSVVENSRVPSVKIKTNGRYFTPFSHINRSLWNYVVHEGQPLVSIDIKTSHPFCLLAFIRDIGENFFGTEGTFEERLKACRFSRQIRLVPNLMHHLSRSLFFYQDCDSYKYIGPNYRKPKTIRKRGFRFFRGFTRYQFEAGKKSGAGNALPHLFHTYLAQSGRVPVSVPVSDCTNSDSFIPDLLTDLSSKFSSAPLTFLHLPYVISVYSPAVLELQHEFISDVSEKFRAYGFYSGLNESPTGKTEGVSLSSTPKQQLSSRQTHGSKTLFTPVFRDLFFPCQEEIAEFERILAIDIYIRLKEVVDVKDTLSRDFFKREFFHFLYRPPFQKYEKRVVERHAPTHGLPPIEPVRKAFGTLLPSILFFLDLCKCPPGTLKRAKGKDREKRFHRFISQAMQAVESQIVLECCDNLLKGASKNILFRHRNTFFCCWA